MAFPRYIRVKGKEIKTLNDYINAEDILFERMYKDKVVESFSMDKNKFIIKGNEETFKNYMDQLELKEFTIYDYRRVERTPIISQEIDDSIYLILEDFIDRYHDNFEHIDSSSVEKFILQLTEIIKI